MKKVGIVVRPNSDAVPELGRFEPIGNALRQRGLAVEVVPFSEESVEQVRDQLLELDGVLVWVDPISGGRDRSVLDPLLREMASRGVWVSTHPDVILKMGTKDVLFTTKDMAWGVDTHTYESTEQLLEELPSRLTITARVLKQHRGNGGNGVWKIELVNPAQAAHNDSLVRVLHAQRGSSIEQMTLRQFANRCQEYFDVTGLMVDQAYQGRLADGMIRCYLVKHRVAGFGHQFVTALLPPPSGTSKSPLPQPRLYYGPAKPEFQALKTKLEDGWVAELQRTLNIFDDDLPALWDADFLLGPKDQNGADTYVLCEINVSSVAPFPDEALEPLARYVEERLIAK